MLAAAELLALVDALLTEDVLIAGSPPPAGRDLDLLVRPPAQRALAGGLRAAGFRASAGASWVRALADGEQEVELIPAAEWSLGRAELAALFADASALAPYEGVMLPAPHHTLLIIARYAHGRPLVQKRLLRARAALAEDAGALVRARELATAWGVQDALGALAEQLATPAAGEA